MKGMIDLLGKGAYVRASHEFTAYWLTHSSNIKLQWSYSPRSI